MKRAILILGMIAAVLVPVYLWWDRRSPYELPEGAVRIYQLDGDRSTEGHESRETLYAWPILQERVVGDAAAAQIRRLLADGRNYHHGGGFKCFNPGMGFRFGDKENAVDVLICIACRHVYFFKSGQEKAVCMIDISDAGVEAFGVLYNTLFPKSAAATTRSSK